MKSIRKSLLLIAAIFLVSVATFGQFDYPVNPNPTGLQTTPYSTAYFSITFDGPVQDSGNFRSTDNQSSNIAYGSESQDVLQIVLVRFVNP